VGRRQLSIYGRQTDWDGDDPDDIKFAVDVIDGDVPVEGWVMLAREFLNDFDREYGQDYAGASVARAGLPTEREVP
jgi:hypothetical protein